MFRYSSPSNLLSRNILDNFFLKREEDKFNFVRLNYTVGSIMTEFTSRSEIDVFNVEKNQYDRFNVSIDFSPRLPQSSNLVGATITAIDSKNMNKTSNVVGGYKIQNKVLIVNVKEGVKDEEYLITIKATTSLSDTRYETKIKLKVI